MTKDKFKDSILKCGFKELSKRVYIFWITEGLALHCYISEDTDFCQVMLRQGAPAANIPIISATSINNIKFDALSKGINQLKDLVLKLETLGFEFKRNHCTSGEEECYIENQNRDSLIGVLDINDQSTCVIALKLRSVTNSGNIVICSDAQDTSGMYMSAGPYEFIDMVYRPVSGEAHGLYLPKYEEIENKLIKGDL